MGSTVEERVFPLTLLHSEQPKLYGILAVLSAVGLRDGKGDKIGIGRVTSRVLQCNQVAKVSVQTVYHEILNIGTLKMVSEIVLIIKQSGLMTHECIPTCSCLAYCLCNY